MRDLGKSDKVLLVEDSNICREAMNLIFSVYYPNHKLLLAHNANEAMQIVNANSDIKLIIVDLSLPDIDGKDLYKHFKNDINSKSIPIVIHSGRVINSKEIEELKKFTTEEMFIISKTGIKDVLLDILKKILGTSPISKNLSEIKCNDQGKNISNNQTNRGKFTNNILVNKLNSKGSGKGI